MSETHWTCQTCEAEGLGDGPFFCPECQSIDVLTFEPASEAQQ